MTKMTNLNPNSFLTTCFFKISKKSKFNKKFYSLPNHNNVIREIDDIKFEKYNKIINGWWDNETVYGFFLGNPLSSNVPKSNKYNYYLIFECYDHEIEITLDDNEKIKILNNSILIFKVCNYFSIKVIS